MRLMRTIDEAAAFLRQADPNTAVTKTALRRLIRSGEIPSGSRWREVPGRSRRTRRVFWWADSEATNHTIWHDSSAGRRSGRSRRCGMENEKAPARVAARTGARKDDFEVNHSSFDSTTSAAKAPQIFSLLQTGAENGRNAARTCGDDRYERAAGSAQDPAGTQGRKTDSVQ